MRKTFLVLFALSALCWLDPFKDNVSEGNKKYDDSYFDEALSSYSRADGYSAGASAKAALCFNKGAAYAKLGKDAEALEWYSKAAASDDAEIQKKSLYNMGNVYSRQGKKKEAAESYIASLKIDPSYDKARKNIEYLMKKDEKKDDRNDKNKEEKDNKGGATQGANKADMKQDGRKGQNKQQSGDGQSDRKIDARMIEGILDSMKKNPVRKNKGKEENAFFGSDKEW